MPVTVDGSATPSSDLSIKATLATNGSWSGHDFTVCLSDVSGVSVGDFCVVVIHYHASPSYMPVDVSSLANQWHVVFAQAPEGRDAPYDGIGTLIACREYQATSNDCLTVALPFSENAVAHVVCYDSAYTMRTVLDVQQKTQLGANPFPGDNIHLGPVSLPQWSSAFYVATADCGNGTIYSSEPVVWRGDTYASNALLTAASRPMRSMSGTWDAGSQDASANDVYTVFPSATRLKAASLVRVMATNAGLPVSATIAAPAANPSTTASAIIVNSLVSRSLFTNAAAQIAGIRSTSGGVSTVSRNWSASSHVVTVLRRNVALPVGAEIKRMSVVSTPIRHPRNSEMHSHSTYTNQVVASSVVSGFSVGTDVQTILQSLWETYSLLSSRNRMPITVPISSVLLKTAFSTFPAGAHLFINTVYGSYTARAVMQQTVLSYSELQSVLTTSIIGHADADAMIAGTYSAELGQFSLGTTSLGE